MHEFSHDAEGYLFGENVASSPPDVVLALVIVLGLEGNFARCIDDEDENEDANAQMLDGVRRSVSASWSWCVARITC
jgi:hypothetical protein